MANFAQLHDDMLEYEMRVFGFQNGDIVLAKISKGKYEGRHIGRVMTRASGSFDIRTTAGKLIGANYQYCRLLQKNNGYLYSYTRVLNN